jgi:hypothetical protein
MDFKIPLLWKKIFRILYYQYILNFTFNRRKFYTSTAKIFSS